MWDVKEPTPLFKKSRDLDPSGKADLYGLWDWVGMEPSMGPMSPIRVHSLSTGLCPEKLVKSLVAGRIITTWSNTTSLTGFFLVVEYHKRLYTTPSHVFISRWRMTISKCTLQAEASYM